MCAASIAPVRRVSSHAIRSTLLRMSRARTEIIQISDRRRDDVENADRGGLVQTGQMRRARGGWRLVMGQQMLEGGLVEPDALAFRTGEHFQTVLDAWNERFVASRTERLTAFDALAHLLD